MNQLSGKYVNVILSAEGGRGMAFLKNNVHIAGNFNGRILESDKIAAEEEPLFNTELVWEVEKKDLRKIRSANQPLRVECLTVDPHNRRERVGFTLISVRSAQIIPLKEANQDLKFKWYKLIGCQADKKRNHPELYLSLAVRDHLLNDTEVSTSLETMPYISEEDTKIVEDLTPSSFPIKYFEDGYIQIGADNAPSTFCLNLLVKELVNLDKLLPEILVFRQNKEKYFISFKIFGVFIKTKAFRKELHNTISLNEKIVVKLMSDQDTLNEFFKTQTININFFCGLDKLGTTSVELENIFTKTDLQCFFKFPSANGIVPFGCTDKSPYIQIKAWLEEEIKETSEDDDEEEEKSKTKTIFSNIPKLPSCCGDQSEGAYVLDNLATVDLKSKSYVDTYEEPIPVFVTKSVDTIIKNVPLSPKKYDALQAYKRYVLDISLKNLIWKNPPTDSKLIFKFLHPRASSFKTIFTEVDNSLGKSIMLSNLDVKLYYISTTSCIKNLINAWPPKLILTDEKERILTEEYEFSTSFLCEDITDKDTVLKTIRTLEPLVKIRFQMSLRTSDSLIQEEEIKTNIILLPAVLDEIIMVNEINDINGWKQSEKQRFEQELEKIKANEVKALQTEWENKKVKMEEQLNKSIKKCKKLQEDLQDRLSLLKIEKCFMKKRNSCNIYEDLFNENWKKYYPNNTKEIIEVLSRTERDNENLKEIIIEQKQQLTVFEKSTLTKNQTSTLLQELRVLEQKFEEVQNAKTYFKEQWKKACEEIHEIKSEDIKSIKSQIQLNKEELSQLSLDKFTNYNNEEQENNLELSPVKSRGFYF